MYPERYQKGFNPVQVDCTAVAEQKIVLEDGPVSVYEVKCIVNTALTVAGSVITILDGTTTIGTITLTTVAGAGGAVGDFVKGVLTTTPTVVDSAAAGYITAESDGLATTGDVTVFVSYL